MYPEEEWLALSGIQHFAFCRRQWALIHLEQQWEENILTVEGDLMHNRAHNETLREKRGSTLILRGLPVHSRKLGLTGKCDVVEFRQDTKGCPLAGEEGSWLPYPVEYKRGRIKVHDEDRLQVCAQAICLEEMLGVEIPKGSLFYGTTHSREDVLFDAALREEVRAAVSDMHDLFKRNHTPKAKKRKSCRSCSIRDICLEGSSSQVAVSDYIATRIKEA